TQVHATSSNSRWDAIASASCRTNRTRRVARPAARARGWGRRSRDAAGVRGRRGCALGLPSGRGTARRKGDEMADRAVLQEMERVLDEVFGERERVALRDVYARASAHVNLPADMLAHLKEV